MRRSFLGILAPADGSAENWRVPTLPPVTWNSWKALVLPLGSCLLRVPEHGRDWRGQSHLLICGLPSYQGEEASVLVRDGEYTIERPGLIWHRICFLQGSKILGYLLSQMLPGGIGHTGLEHLWGCCKALIQTWCQPCTWESTPHILGSLVSPESD